MERDHSKATRKRSIDQKMFVRKTKFHSMFFSTGKSALHLPILINQVLLNLPIKKIAQ